MKTVLMSLVAAALSLPAAAQTGAAPAAVGDAAKAKVSMCTGCHGVPLYRTAYPEVYRVPKIGGQSPAYIIKAMQAYRSGERSHPGMVGIARGLSDAEMADLAAYYGR